MAIEVPLFPLGTVLFPHMPMSLHIFEERYKTMMRDCRRSSTTFGIVAIRAGQETGGSAVPFEVGTLAQLDEIEELPDGGYNLVVVGASRFHIDALSHLPLHHRDPFDRLIIAQALTENLTVVTRDRSFALYPGLDVYEI